MSRISTSQVIDRPPEAVWDRLADLADHVNWMADAATIRFTGDRRQGVGTAFDCETRVGPLRTVDRMEVIEWTPPEALAVRHQGLVTGSGRFTLRGSSDGLRTELTWDEDLRFPRHLGGRVTAALAGPVLRRVWSSNLRRFAALVEGAASGAAGG